MKKVIIAGILVAAMGSVNANTIHKGTDGVLAAVASQLSTVSEQRGGNPVHRYLSLANSFFGRLASEVKEEADKDEGYVLQIIEDKVAALLSAPKYSGFTDSLEGLIRQFLESTTNTKSSTVIASIGQIRYALNIVKDLKNIDSTDIQPITDKIHKKMSRDKFVNDPNTNAKFPKHHFIGTEASLNTVKTLVTEFMKTNPKTDT